MPVAGEHPFGQQVVGGDRAGCVWPADGGSQPRECGACGDVGRGEVVGARADHHGPVAEEPHHGVGRRVRVVLPAQDHHQPVALGRAQCVHARDPGRTSYLVEEVLAALGRGVAEDDAHPTAVRPPEGAGPGGHGLVGLGAQHGVDHQRLEPGVPGAAGLRGAGVDLGGGEGDLAGVAQDRGVHGRSVRRVDHLVDVGLDDLDAEPDQVDGLAEGDHAGQGPGRSTEDSGGGVTGRGPVVAESEPVHEALDTGLEDLPDPGPALGREVGEPRHVGEHPRHRGAAQRAGGTSQRVRRALPRGLRSGRIPPGSGLREGGGGHVPTLVRDEGPEESRMNTGFPAYRRRVDLVESGRTATGDRRCRCASTACST